MNDYIPIDLSRKQISNIFNACVENIATINKTSCVLFKKENGFKEDSRPIIFDTDKLNSYRGTIEGLFGQLNDIHQKNKITSPNTISKKYDGSTWLTSRQGLIEILHLGTALNILGPLKPDNTMPIIKEIYPTLSPDDPDFKTWYVENYSKIKSFMNPGQEPADN